MPNVFWFKIFLIVRIDRCLGEIVMISLGGVTGNKLTIVSDLA
jgi:hypothetical protein